MAEHVQAAMDEMVVPLRDLQDRGIFSVSEIRSIVNRRRDSEYDLRRRIGRKADFLQYIQAETNLEQLRRLRMKRLKREDLRDKSKKEGVVVHDEDANDNAAKSRPGDRHVLQHIHSLWTRAIRKFGQEDVSLHLQYAEFCKTIGSSSKRLSACYATALSLHPKVTGLWIDAASHEFFETGSVQSARVLLQRGLRMNPTAIDLWVQSFLLELHSHQKMRARRKVLLQKDDGSGKDDDNDDSDESSRQKSSRALGASSLSSSASKNNNNGNNKGLAIAGVVLRNARKALSNDDNSSITFLLQCLHQCRLFPDTDSLQEDIVTAIREDCCSDQPDAWIARASYELERMTVSSKKNASDAAADDDDDDDDADEDNGGSGGSGFVVRSKAIEEEEENNDDDNDDDNDDGESSQEGNGEDEPSPTKQRKRQRQVVHCDSFMTDSSSVIYAILKEALATIPTEKMYLQTIQFIRDHADELDDLNGRPQQQKPKQEAAKSSSRCQLGRRAFLDTVFQQVSIMTGDVYSPGVAVQYARHLEQEEEEKLVVVGRDKDSGTNIGNDAAAAAAVAVLEDYVKRYPERASLDARVWIAWAGLVVSSTSSSSDESSSCSAAAATAAVQILERALSVIPMNRIEHFTVLLQLLGAKLLVCQQQQQQQERKVVHNDNDDDDDNDNDDASVSAWETFQRVLLLAPGFADNKLPDRTQGDHDDDDREEYYRCPFGIRTASKGCLSYLQYETRRRGVTGGRKVYSAVLFRSTFAEKCFLHEPETLSAFLDESIRIEREAASTTRRLGCSSSKRLKITAAATDPERQQHYLRRLYDAAVQLFSKRNMTQRLADRYRQRRDDDIRYG